MCRRTPAGFFLTGSSVIHIAPSYWLLFSISSVLATAVLVDFLFILINSNILQNDWFKCWRGPAESQCKHFCTAMISNMQLFPFIALNPFNFGFHNFLLNTSEDFMLKLRLSESLCALHRSPVFFSFTDFYNICSRDTIFLYKERLKTV